MNNAHTATLNICDMVGDMTLNEFKITLLLSGWAATQVFTVGGKLFTRSL